jgi:hypothetical protein
MTDTIPYSRARREHYMQRLGTAQQIGAILDELAALRSHLGETYQGAESLTAIQNIIADIKQQIPKDPA